MYKIEYYISDDCYVLYTAAGQELFWSTGWIAFREQLKAWNIRGRFHTITT